MTQALEATGTQALALFSGGGINAQDIVLPALALRQNAYRKDNYKKFKPGDVFIRPADEKVADEEKGLAFVPVSIEKCYRVMDITGGSQNARCIRYESADVEKPLEFAEGKFHLRRDRTFIVHALLRESLANQAAMFERLQKGEVVDPDDIVLPCRIVFTRGSYNAGKILNTHFEMSAAIKQSPAIITFQLKSTERKNDQGAWFVYDVTKLSKDDKYTPRELLPACDFWVKTMAVSRFKAHEVEEEVVVDAETAQPTDVAGETDRF